MPCSTIGESGLHTLTVISSGCPDEQRPNAHVAAAGHPDELPQTQAIKAVRGGLNYTKPYIFFFLHFLSVHVKRDLQTRD
jgi:hypothetical protein